MPATASPDNYCVCIGEDGAPHEISRRGAAISYKAMGYQSGQAVALQLIPLATVSEAGRALFEEKARAVRKLKHPNIARAYDLRVEDDHIVFATEYLEGETAESWVIANGPMPPDAVARVGLQIVSALAEAAFHSLSHRALQPSNLMILNGAAPDGEWPFVKLLNFGLAGLKLYSEGTDELAPPINVSFASPEQLTRGMVDFRSEIFSLGATMCFLLTGAVPVPGRSRRSGEGERQLPRGVPIPRVLRRLLRRMLRIDPAERPQDPLLLSAELRACIDKLEPRRRAVSKVAPIPLQAEPVGSLFPRRRFGRVFAAAALLLLFAAVAAVLLPERVRAWVHRDQPLSSIGVPVGIPDPQALPSPTIAPVESPPVIAEERATGGGMVESQSAAEQPATQDQPLVADQNARSPVPASTPDAPQIASNSTTAEPPPPAEAPPATPAVAPQNTNDDLEVLGQESQPAAKNNDVPAAPAAASEVAAPTRAGMATTTTSKTSPIASKRRSESRAKQTRTLPPMRVGTTQARFVGTTPEGKWILRLESGRTVVTPPLPDTTDFPTISHRKVRKMEAPPRAMPANQLPPVVVLPPEG